MEQYWMSKKLDFKNLRMCLDNYTVESLYIIDCGGVREDGTYRVEGMVKINIDLEDRNLDFRKDTTGLYLLIDSEEVFHFPLQDYHKGFSLAYERIEPAEDGIGRVDPYDPTLPEPRRSFLRIALDKHVMEIFFKGRVDVKFHSWWQKPHWKYWTVIKPRKS